MARDHRAIASIFIKISMSYKFLARALPLKLTVIDNSQLNTEASAIHMPET
jgi:hypothetical protein